MDHFCPNLCMSFQFVFFVSVLRRELWKVFHRLWELCLSLLTASQKQVGCCALLLLMKQRACPACIDKLPSLRLPYLWDCTSGRQYHWMFKDVDLIQTNLHVCLWTATAKTYMFWGTLYLWSAIVECYFPHSAGTVEIPQGPEAKSEIPRFSAYYFILFFILMFLILMQNNKFLYNISMHVINFFLCF